MSDSQKRWVIQSAPRRTGKRWARLGWRDRLLFRLGLKNWALNKCSTPGCDRITMFPHCSFHTTTDFGDGDG